MARITVEDCLNVIKKCEDKEFTEYGRFSLIVAVTDRAKKLACGERATVTSEKDKNPVLALREFAANHINPTTVIENVVHNLSQYNKQEKLPEEENEVEQESDFDFIPEGSSYDIPSEELDQLNEFGEFEDADFTDDEDIDKD